MKHTKGTSLSILCLPVHKMADCNRFLQCYSRHAYARLQEKLRGLEVSCRNNRQARTQHPWSGTRRSRPRRPVSRAAPPSTMTARDRPGPRRRRRPYTRAHRRDRCHRRRRWRTWRRRRKRRWRRRIKSPWPRRPPSSFERALDGIRTGSQGDTRRCIPSVCRAAPARCWRSQSRLACRRRACNRLGRRHSTRRRVSAVVAADAAAACSCCCAVQQIGRRIDERWPRTSERASADDWPRAKR